VDQASDEELMLSAMRGDRLAISVLVERYYRPLFAYLFRLTDGDRPTAEDLLQDTFTRLLAPHTYTSGRAVKPWLYAIATNLVRDRYRVLSRRGIDPKLVTTQQPAVDDPADRALRSEDERAVRAAVRSLSQEQRAAIVLRFYQGLSLAEIALALDIPLGTVKSRLSIGTRRLRALLQPLREPMNQ
jgi:RNA polymerase sigma factor (sigma-70 family)